ncbi:MAG TPA: TetR/AcrR family transcriptional regulator [Mycobacterium sp.]|nr:TetR/AcrR family transcriptional regulator [Mycobacterium sp.]
MADGTGLRERKKQRTRDALIAAAADVTTRTFFLHFPAKEDVLFANAEVRVDIGLKAIADRSPGESISDVLARSMADMMANTFAGDLTTGLAALRARLVMSTPSLLARQLHRLLAAQSELAQALQRAYPDELDLLGAAARVGAVTGAVSAAAATSLAQGDGPEQVQAAMSRALDIALHRARG